MKQLISAILTLLIFSGCRKIASEKQTLPVETKRETVTENGNDDVFICELPIVAEFPGGTAAWQRFLKQNLVYPESAIDENIQGTVTVQFTVCDDGTLCDIEAISGPAELKESAIQVFKKSPKWTPTRLNGRNIKDYKKQPIIFRLEEE
jgi:protein TonB